MRPELLDPIRDKSKLEVASDLARRCYSLHEFGQSYSELLAELSRLVGKPVNKADVRGAFGSIDHETFARDLVVERDSIPADLSDPEMIELIERVSAADGDEFQIGYWVECLQRNTGDQRISDLIYWPGEYFGDGDNSRQMTARQILDVALVAGRNK